MKKVLALVLAALLVIGMMSIALADPTSYYITINNAKKGHTYTAYQVFSGTYVAGTAASIDPETGDPIPATNPQLTNIQWGDGVTATFIAGRNAAAVAEALTTETHARALAGQVAESGNLGTAAGHVDVTADGSATIDTLPAGYYVILDTATAEGTVNEEDDVYSSYIVQLLGNQTINNKAKTPELDKDIIENSTNVEAADKAIGDTVTYELTGTLPDNYDEFRAYKYIFHDTLSVGQAFKADTVKVYKDSVADANDITAKFTCSRTTDSDGTSALTFTISNNNLKDATNGVSDLTASSKIIVRYDAVITSAAVLGSAGNRNAAYLEYSNNPNSDGEGTTKTPVDYTLVFTYELNPTKVDGANSSVLLGGAQFVLKATNGEHNGKWVQIDASSKKVTGWLDTKPTAVDSEPTSGNTGVLYSQANGLFPVIGLDAGTYELEEIQAPAGYNLLTSTVSIVITAVVDSSETNPALTSVKITIDSHEDTNNYNSTGILPATVTNNSGTTLPSTGGIGTTIFYVTGLIMVLGAATILISRRRAESK